MLFQKILLILSLSLFLLTETSIAQELKNKEKLPPATEVGLSEKLIRKTRPRFGIPRKQEIPEIIVTQPFSPGDFLAQLPLPPSTESGLGEKSLRQSQPKFQPPPQQEAPEIVVPDSRKVVDPSAGPAFVVKKIIINGNSVFGNETLLKAANFSEGGQMTMGLLLLMAQEITSFYGSNGYFLARAYIPAQKIKDGVVSLQISEGKIGKIEITGNKKVDAEELKKFLIRVNDESNIKEQTLERTLLELNDMIGVTVRSLLKPGELPGTSNLVLEVKESQNYSYGIDGDNFGSRFTGRNRLGVTATVGNLLTLGDRFSIRGSSSNLNQRFIAPNYTFPVNYYGTTVGLSYTYSQQKLGRELNSLEAGGRTNIFTVEVSHPLYRSRFGQLAFKTGFNLKNFKNFRLGETTSNDQLRGFYGDLGGNYTDSFQGRTFGSLRVSRGLSETDDRTLLSRFRGRGDASILEINLTRYQSVALLNSYFIMKAFGQIVDKRVLSPDQFAVGGIGTVRGFTLSEISGDMGYVSSLEWNVPFPSDYPIGVGDLTLRQTISFLGFIDHGRTYIKDRQPGEFNDLLTGVGAGVSVNFGKTDPWGPSTNFSLVYGYPLFGPNPADASSGILYVSAAVNYF